MVVQLQMERILRQRDAEAAVYLLQKMLGISKVPQARRLELQRLQERIEKKHSISDAERRQVATAYHEVIG